MVTTVDVDDSGSGLRAPCLPTILAGLSSVVQAPLDCRLSLTSVASWMTSFNVRLYHWSAPFWRRVRT